jgi:hypothetical protein
MGKDMSGETSGHVNGESHNTTVIIATTIPTITIATEEKKHRVMEVDLYDQCFVGPRPYLAVRSDPKVAFAEVLSEIKMIEPRGRAQVNLEMVMPRGHVFAVHEIGSNFVSIGHGGKSCPTSILRRMQISNPRQLEIIAVLRRYSFDDARLLCETIKSGLIIFQCGNKNWYTIENCKQKIVAMFSRIDKIEDLPSRDLSHRPILLRQPESSPVS